MELTPRALDDDDVTVEEGEVSPRGPRSRRRTRRRWMPLAVLAVVVLGIGALVYKGLNDATLYFRNADEAVAQRDDLGSKRFRLQGTVVGEPTYEGDQVRFDVSYNGVSVAVTHTGSPPDMFRPGIPVVIEGRWADDSDVFAGDRILVKHDETYESQDDYQERIGEAEEGGDATPAAGDDGASGADAPAGSGG
ncbi:MAG TPA: cytochrome c maturation protein CcmE [Acidimicrobiales bacterium]|nr:cytochrome c maturation protein CcmE [Acidimicrobiales bacterium]